MEEYFIESVKATSLKEANRLCNIGESTIGKSCKRENMRVYITGFGLRPFKPEEYFQLNENHPKQFKGKYLLPENTELMTGEKWVDLDYWFEESQII